MQILVQGQFSSLEINWLKSSAVSLFFTSMLFSVRGHYSEKESNSTSLAIFRYFVKLQFSKYLNNFTNLFLVIWNFLNFYLATTRKKDDLVLLGWSLQSPLHVGNNHDEEERMRYDH